MIPIRVGIDLGTSNVLVNIGGRIVVREPSVVALDRNAGKVLAVGSQVVDMVGRTPQHIVAVRPLRDGVITHFDLAVAMLRHCLKGISWLRRPSLVVTVPAGVSSVQRHAVVEAGMCVGAAKVSTVEEPLAAALGCGVDMRSPGGVLVVDIGGGTTDVAVLSMGMVVASKSVKAAGERMDAAISAALRREYGIIVEPRTAETLKINVATAVALGEGREMEIRGSDAVNGLPRSQVVSGVVTNNAIMQPLSEISAAVADVLSVTPPELAGDIARDGMILSGGGALLSGVSAYLGKEIGIPVRVAQLPLDCVALGTLMVNATRA